MGMKRFALSFLGLESNMLAVTSHPHKCYILLHNVTICSKGFEPLITGLQPVVMPFHHEQLCAQWDLNPHKLVGSQPPYLIGLWTLMLVLLISIIRPIIK